MEANGEFDPRGYILWYPLDAPQRRSGHRRRREKIPNCDPPASQTGIVHSLASYFTDWAAGGSCREWNAKPSTGSANKPTDWFPLAILLTSWGCHQGSKGASQIRKQMADLSRAPCSEGQTACPPQDVCLSTPGKGRGAGTSSSLLSAYCWGEFVYCMNGRDEIQKVIFISVISGQERCMHCWNLCRHMIYGYFHFVFFERSSLLLLSSSSTWTLKYFQRLHQLLTVYRKARNVSLDRRREILIDK